MSLDGAVLILLLITARAAGAAFQPGYIRHPRRRGMTCFRVDEVLSRYTFMHGPDIMLCIQTMSRVRKHSCVLVTRLAKVLLTRLGHWLLSAVCGTSESRLTPPRDLKVINLPGKFVITWFGVFPTSTCTSYLEVGAGTPTVKAKRAEQCQANCTVSALTLGSETMGKCGSMEAVVHCMNS